MHKSWILNFERMIDWMLEVKVLPLREKEGGLEGAVVLSRF